MFGPQYGSWLCFQPKKSGFEVKWENPVVNDLAPHSSWCYWDTTKTSRDIFRAWNAPSAVGSITDFWKCLPGGGRDPSVPPCESCWLWQACHRVSTGASGTEGENTPIHPSTGNPPGVYSPTSTVFGFVASLVSLIRFSRYHWQAYSGKVLLAIG